LKRITVIIGLALALVGIGATAAFAGSDGAASDTCSNGSWTEQPVVNSPVYVGTEHGPHPSWGADGTTSETVCYSDTAPNGSPSNIAGGYCSGGFNQTGFVGAGCVGDDAMLTLNWDLALGVQTTDDTNPATVGRTAAAQASVTSSNANLQQTGVQVNPAISTDAPLDGDATSAASVGTGTDSCMWVNGTQNCPFGITAAGVTVNEADVVDLNTPGTGCIGVNSICLVPNTGIGIGQDSSSTIEVTSVSPIGTKTANLPAHCVQVGASC
jgi:hypothetical protein